MSHKETKNTVKPHTEAKLKFYINYLERYLPILYKTPYVDKINIYDMFCGQAIYDDGKESGAVRAFKIIKEVQKKNPSSNTEITLTLNDLNKKRITKIKEWLKLQEKSFITRTYNDDATNLINKLLTGINNRQKNSTRNLVFIDPYGYKEIDKDLIEGLLSNYRTEVIIFLPISQMNRFKHQTLGDDVKKDFLPLKDFVDQFNINVVTIDGEAELIKAIEQSFSFKKEYFSTSYHIKNQQGKRYALFFMTSHIYGLEKIIEVKWALDKQQGSGFDDTNQMDMFLEMQKIDELKEKAKRYLQNSRTNNEIYEWTLTQGFLPKQMNIILREFKRDNEIKIKYFLDAKSGYHLNHQNHKDRVIKVEVQLKS